MSISSALFSGISGLSTNGNAMSVIGDNIANVNTIGYKSSRTTFQDVLAQSVATASGTSQIGRGAALSSIDTLFQQGSFESTSNATDLAIGGQGFFIVSPRAEETQYYTRAGQFRFDSDGYFINPEGYVGRGWALDDNGNDVGTLQPVRLSAFTSPPEPTNAITAITNLNSEDTSKVASLFTSAWDANNATEPIGDAQYGYQTSIRVYDSLGRSHDVTVYYDKASGSEYDDGTPTNNIDNTWEYIVTSNPDDDLRTAFAAADSRGILMRGTVAFNATTGALESQTSFVWDGLGAPDADASWIPSTTFSSDGYAEVNAEFVAGVPQAIATEFGTRSTTSAWVGGAANVSAIAANGLPTSSWQPQALTSTQYASSSTTIYQTQDGYGTGFLENISVGTDGIMVGHYSNGQILNLFRVGLAKFNNQQALSKVGGNLWSATRDSGDAITGHPGENGLGRVSSNSLEQSNVDIAAEFVKMITTERGFQANSRIITTVDNMLQELINLKR
jgi:flagellar hook protein FlgE